MAVYRVDKKLSKVSFSVKHLFITNARGSFGDFEATMTSTERDFLDAQLNFTASVDTLATGVTARDEYLKSSDFFDVSKWPSISYASSLIKKTDATRYVVEGLLTIRDISEALVLDADHKGYTIDDSGESVHLFSLRGSLSRKSYDLNFSHSSLGCNVLVDDHINIEIDAFMRETKDA
jgi:polyisoprenoid-binding protein YceI